MNPFQTLLNNYHQDREKQEYEQFIEEERRRHGHHRQLKQSRGTGEWRPFLVAPRRAGVGAGGRFSGPTRSAAVSSPLPWEGAAQADRRRLPVFSFDAVHLPFCVTPSPRQTPPDGDARWTPTPSTLRAASPACETPLQAWSLPIASPASLAPSTPVPTRPPPRLVLPSLTPIPQLPALVDAEPASPAPALVAAISSVEPLVVTPTMEKADESEDALLSLITLSCASPTASPRQQSRRLQRASVAGEKLSELAMRKRKRDACEESSRHGENEEQQFCHRRRRSSAERNKRRRVELNADVPEVSAEQHETHQQSTSEVESDVEESSNSNNEDVNDLCKQRQQQHLMLLGEESANEDEADESHRRPDQKMVMETEEDEDDDEDDENKAEQEIVCRGRRRIWASISSRELASLQWHQPLPGRRQTRVALMGLGRLHVRPASA